MQRKHKSADFDRKTYKVANFPARSPDLIPIENLYKEFYQK